MLLLPEYALTRRDTVHHADALSLLRALPDASIDSMITDFPYNTTANTWESDIALSDNLWREIWRVSKSETPVITTASQPFTSLLIVKLLKEFRCEWIWEKTRPTGYLNANRAPMKTHENILVFGRNGTIYNPQMIAGRPYRATRGAVGGHVRDKTVGGYITENDGWRYPKSVLHFDSINGVHPSEKPLALYEYLVSTYSRRGDLILDPFAGSGTTLVAARNLGRHYIGCDLSAEYVEIARQRLAQPYTQPMFETLPVQQAVGE